MTNLDYRKWLARAKRFIAHVSKLPSAPDKEVEASFSAKPPLSHRATRRLQSALPRPLPEPMRRFMEEGSAGCEIHYLWERQDDDLFGGAPLCDAASLPQWCSECQEMADSLERSSWSEAPKEKEMWARVMPFARQPNADYLALDVRGGEEDLPVLYMCHDGESFRLAATFDRFLEVWERLCYVGPAWWVIQEFRDARSGLLTAETKKAAMLRQLFRWDE